MTEQADAQPVWFWNEVNPKTATIVGAFGEVPLDIFSLEKSTADVASRGFRLPSEAVMPTQQIIQQAYAELQGETVEHDPEAIQKAVIDKLRECESDERQEVLSELGRLAAGDSAPVAALAELAGEKIEGERPYNTIPLLRALSTLAIHRLAGAQLWPNGPLRWAYRREYEAAIATPSTAEPRRFDYGEGQIL